MSETLPGDGLGDFNTGAWEQGDYVSAYSGHTILPAEAALLARYSGPLAGAVVELGCGGGRLTRVLVSLSDRVTALDISPRMVAACTRNVPAAHAEVGDLRDLTRFGDDSVQAIVASNNLIDVLGDADRRRALAGFARILTADGVLLFSSHNQANIPFLDTSLGSFARGALHSPRDFARAVYHARNLPRRMRNRRTARSFEVDGSEYAIVNDPVHEHRLAHYYIRRDAQERQLAGAGLVLDACLDADARDVASGQEAARSTELHYAARIAATKSSTS